MNSTQNTLQNDSTTRNALNMYKTGDTTREMFSSTFHKGRNSLHENNFRNDSLMNTFQFSGQKQKENSFRHRKFSEGQSKQKMIHATPTKQSADYQQDFGIVGWSKG